MMIWLWLLCKFCSGFHLVSAFIGLLLSSFDLLCGLLIYSWSLRVLCGALEVPCALVVQVLLGLTSLLFRLYTSTLYSLMCYLIGRSLSCSWFLP